MRLPRFFAVPGLLRRAATIGVALWLLAAVSSAAVLVMHSTGISGYSGKTGVNCNICHHGGTAPTVTLGGPLFVLHDSTRTFSFLVSGGQKVAAGLDVAVNAGSLTASESGTHLDHSEVTHDQPKNVDNNGDASWTFDFNAPTKAGLATIFASGNSVNLSGDTNGDKAASTKLVVTVVDNLTSFTEFGQGLAGSGGFVPHLFGVDGPSIGPWSVNIEQGLGGAAGLLWAGLATTDQFPVFGGHFYVDLSVQPWIFVPIALGGTPGVDGDGSLQIDGIDVSGFAPLTIYMQATILDSGAARAIALSNALQMDVQS